MHAKNINIFKEQHNRFKQSSNNISNRKNMQKIINRKVQNEENYTVSKKEEIERWNRFRQKRIDQINEYIVQRRKQYIVNKILIIILQRVNIGHIWKNFVQYKEERHHKNMLLFSTFLIKRTLVKRLRKSGPNINIIFQNKIRQKMTFITVVKKDMIEKKAKMLIYPFLKNTYD